MDEDDHDHDDHDDPDDHGDPDDPDNDDDDDDYDDDDDDGDGDGDGDDGGGDDDDDAWCMMHDVSFSRKQVDNILSPAIPIRHVNNHVMILINYFHQSGRRTLTKTVVINQDDSDSNGSWRVDDVRYA